MGKYTQILFSLLTYALGGRMVTRQFATTPLTFNFHHAKAIIITHYSLKQTEMFTLGEKGVRVIFIACMFRTKEYGFHFTQKFKDGLHFQK